MQFQITESQQIVTWASLLLLPCLSKCCPATNTELPPQQHESTTSSECVFLLQVTPPTAVDRQIYSVHARDTHENYEADL